MSFGSLLRVLIVEDFPVIRDGLIGWLSGRPGFAVAGHAATGASALSALGRGGVDVVLLDLMLEDGLAGISLVRDLRQAYPAVPILVFSLQDEKVYAERAIRAGASGYLMKRAQAEEMLHALRTVAGGELYVSRSLSDVLLKRLMHPAKAAGVMDADRAGALRGLTDRELHVFQLIGAGQSMRQIAARLGLSLKTVETHRENIKNKLNLHNAGQVLQRAALWVNERRFG